MDIIINHTLRSIKNNAVQFIVILLTVTLVTCVVFVALTIGGLFYNVNIGMDARLGADTDITLDGDVFSKTRLDEFLALHDNDIEYADTYLQMGGLFRENENSLSKAVLIEATDVTALVARHPTYVKIKEEYKGNYQYPAVWVGEGFAKENNLAVGDTVELYLEMYREYQKMTLTYIMADQGVFANSVVNNVIIDFDAINNKGIISMTNIKVRPNADAGVIGSELLKYMDNDQLKVRSSVDYEHINSIVKNNQLLLNICLIFIVALMLYILFTAYLVIMKGRMNELSIFKSAGATPTQMSMILLSEALLYGFFGAVMGLIMGRIGMGVAVSKVIPNFVNAVQYGVGDYVVAFLLGIFVSLLSALYPAVKAGKMQVRQLTSGGIKVVKKPKLWLLIVSSVLLAVAVVILLVLPGFTLVSSIILTVLVAVWIFLITPYLLELFSLLFTKGKGSHRIAGYGLKRNSYSRTLSALLGSIITFTFIVVMIVDVIIIAVKPFNARFNADYVIQNVEGQPLDGVKEKLSKVYGIESAYKYNYDEFVWTQNNQKTEYKVYGIDSTDGLKNIAKDISEETVKKFNTTVNGVIVSYDLAKRFNLTVGDKIKLAVGTKTQTVGDLSSTFEVVGLEYSMTQNDKVMIIDNENFVMENSDYRSANSMIFINIASDVFAMDLYKQTRDIVEQDHCFILKFDDWAYATSVGLRGIMTLLNILQYIVSAVAVIGVINLIVVAFGERKREFAIYKSIGMDAKAHTKIVLAEGGIIALSGGIVGFLMTVVVNILIPNFALIIDRYIIFNPLPLQIPVIVTAMSVLFVLVYLFVAKFVGKRAKAEEKIPLF